MRGRRNEIGSRKRAQTPFCTVFGVSSTSFIALQMKPPSSSRFMIRVVLVQEGLQTFLVGRCRLW